MSSLLFIFPLIFIGTKVKCWKKYAPKNFVGTTCTINPPFWHLWFNVIEVFVIKVFLISVLAFLLFYMCMLSWNELLVTLDCYFYVFNIVSLYINGCIIPSGIRQYLQVLGNKITVCSFRALLNHLFTRFFFYQELEFPLTFPWWCHIIGNFF